jgi:tetratricopeptide (TPR) repeat protein
MGQVLYFGGSAPVDSTPESLEEFDAGAFYARFLAWLGTNYAAQPDAPRDAQALASYDKWALIPRFRAEWETGRVSIGGTSMEASVSSMELELRQPVMCLIASNYSDQPAGRISRKRFSDPKYLAAALARNLRSWSTSSIAALLYDGRIGHCVLVTGSSVDEQSIRFRDPWPGESLVFAGRSEGQCIVPDPEYPGEWRIPTAAFATVLVALQIPEAYWRWWQSDLSVSAPSNEPFDPWQRWTGPPDDEDELVLVSRVKQWTNNYGSRRALALAAIQLAALLGERNLIEEACRWLRQAAIAGFMPAARTLAILLRRCPDATDASETDLDQLYWRRRHRVLEARYWRRQFMLARRGRNFWDVEPDELDEDTAPATASQVYQWAGPFGAEYFEAARNFADQGDIGRARREYDRVICSDHPIAAAAAAYESALLLSDTGDLAGARDLFRRATLSANLLVIPWAAVGLGGVLAELGDMQGALEAYERAIYGISTEASLSAELALGDFYAGKHQLKLAATGYMRAATSDNPEYATQGVDKVRLLYESMRDTSR